MDAGFVALLLALPVLALLLWQWWGGHFLAPEERLLRHVPAFPRRRHALGAGTFPRRRTRGLHRPGPKRRAA